MNSNVSIKASNLFKSYSSHSNKITQVLNGLSVEIKEGEFVALMGASGAGKSTLLYLLGSLDTPDSGEIVLNIENTIYNYHKLNSDEIANFRNKHIGFIFQFHHLLPEFTALENVMMPAIIAGNSFLTSSVKALELFNDVDIDIRSNHKPTELSGGEQQRVAIARALINNPNIVLADEPTGNLDEKNAKAVLDLISKLRKKYKLTFVVATHSPEVAKAAERILVIKDGIIQI